MDPKQQISQLDPKVKEAYDRVMNASVTPPASTSPQPNNPTPSVTTPVVPSTVVQTPSAQPVNPAAHTVPSTPTIVAGMPQPSTVRREPEKIHIGSVPNTTAAKKKTSNGISPIIYIIGGFIFLVVYTIFWLKFFNVPVPFLP